MGFLQLEPWHSTVGSAVSECNVSQAEADGSYSAEYTVRTAGSYSLQALVAGSPVGPVYTVAVATGNVNITTTTVALGNWDGTSELTAGDHINFEITARDKGVPQLCV
jgi:hypothetical protein